MDISAKAKLEAEKAKHQASKGGGIPWGPIIGVAVSIGTYLYISQVQIFSTELAAKTWNQMLPMKFAFCGYP